MLSPFAEKDRGFRIDSPNQRILAEDCDALVSKFTIDLFRKYILVNGLDGIGLNIKNE